MHGNSGTDAVYRRIARRTRPQLLRKLAMRLARSFRTGLVVAVIAILPAVRISPAAGAETGLTLVSASQRTFVGSDGTSSVTILGEVANNTPAAVEEPDIKIDLLDKNDAPITTLAVQPVMRVIRPGWRSPFTAGVLIHASSDCTPSSDVVCQAVYPAYDHFRVEQPIAAPPQVHRSFQNLDVGYSPNSNTLPTSDALSVSITNLDTDPLTGIAIVASYYDKAGTLVAYDIINAPDLARSQRASFDYKLLANVDHSQVQLQAQAPAWQPAGPMPGSRYWTAASDGGVFSWYGAPFFGSMGGRHLNSPIVGISPTPAGDGYWLVAADGGVFAFGAAPFLGSMGATHLNSPIVGISATPAGDGYWLVAADGGVFAFGAAPFLGSMGGTHLNAPVVGMTPTPETFRSIGTEFTRIPAGTGYWLVAADGGVFSFGTAGFDGGTGGIHLNAPIVGIAAAPFDGYWLVAADGGVFNFGFAEFEGAATGWSKSPFVAIDALHYGFHLVTAANATYAFGNIMGADVLPSTFPVVGLAHVNDPIPIFTERFVPK